MSDEKVRSLVRWNSADAEAIAEQLLERVRRAKRKGLTVGVVTCLVHADESGDRCYEPAFSTLPVEVTNWAAESIKRRVVEEHEKP
jgi:hypothetical protein